MPFPNRALVGAPVARDLDLEKPGHYIARIPGAVIAGYQVWDTLDQDFWQGLADPQLKIVGNLAALRALPAGLGTQLFLQIVQVPVYTDATLTTQKGMKRIAALVAGDFWSVVRNDASIAVRDGPPIAGDVRPNGARGGGWEYMHIWAGDTAATLGG